MTAERLLAVIRSRGSDADTLRDGVHEAVHAIQAGLKDPWEREAIHEALQAKAAIDSQIEFKAKVRMLVWYELQARACEWLACERFKIEYDIEYWALMMSMETVKTFHISPGTLEDVIEAIKITKQQLETKMLLDRVLALRAKRSRKASDATAQ